MLRTSATTLLVLSLAGGCAASGAGPDPVVAMKAGQPALVEETRADAAKRAGVPLDRATVVASEAVTWRDGSLGCPKPGMMYTQALVPGWRVRIEAGGTIWEYHADRRGRWDWCPPDRVQDPGPNPAS